MTTKLRWHKTAVAAGMAALLSLSATGAMALGLGRVTVLSALGEPLRAEIEVTDINEEEAVSLRASAASPESFRAAGLPYNPAMAELSFALGRRPDGRTVIKVTSPRSINDTFVDMIVEVNWSTGRIVRDYTMMFDPPPPVATPSADPDPPRTSGPRSAPQPANPGKTPSQRAASGDQQVVVKPGDTASKIARLTKTDDVTLDQMMIALVQSNPEAFSKGNVNRLRSGAVLDLPSAEEAKSVDSAEASRMVAAQGKAFNEFRRKLATNLPRAAEKGSNRQTSGKLDNKSDEKKPVDGAPDKLTLSKGGLQGTSKEAQIAQQLAEKEAAARAAELAKNIADLNKLGADTATKVTPAASASASAAAASAAAVPAQAASLPAAPTVTVATAPPVETASAPTPVASEPVAPASAPEPVASAVPAATASKPAEPQTDSNPLPVEAPGIVGELLADPVVPVVGGVLVTLLGGLFLYLRQRGKKKQAPAKLLADVAQEPVVDTTPVDEASTTPAAAADTADNTDPLAEATLYLSYGHDVQAEDVLRDALTRTPGRLALHNKLLEIYANRKDVNAFQEIAEQAFRLTGKSPEWTRICEMGLAIDPDNPLYQLTDRPRPEAPKPTPVPPPAAPPPKTEAAQPLGFDLSSLSLDLNVSDSPDDEAANAQEQMKTKLALAEEFMAIEDSDGARALLEEVLAEATGQLRAKAQSALDKLNQAPR